ncbi:hypothetical protein SAMN05660657_04709 [Geodermatophilus amargosae]|uniref:Uncharacterized protein n=1 Tax=Geodermatophilus amargosae TaxID=1296565 RepID=A0A1I7CP53_9ACTN|nr:hypothetical protein SAMN05660657_04709 [Geodermatophilus amargosae]
MTEGQERYFLALTPTGRRQLTEHLPAAVATAASECIVGPLLDAPPCAGSGCAGRSRTDTTPAGGPTGSRTASTTRPALSHSWTSPTAATPSGPAADPGSAQRIKPPAHPSLLSACPSSRPDRGEQRPSYPRPFQPVRATCSHSGNPRSLDGNGFTLPWPGRHRGTDGRQRLPSGVPELKRGADRDGQTDAWAKVDLAPTTSFLLPPHDAEAPEDVPDLADRPVLQRPRDFTAGQLEVRHPSARKTRQDPDAGPVRSDVHVADGQELLVEGHRIVQ